MKPCLLQGNEIRQEKCYTCGNRSTLATIYGCPIYDECAHRPYNYYQAKDKKPVQICLTCRDKMTPDTTSIVYIYAHQFASRPYKDELRWSLRSLANIDGKYDPVIVGDPPEWYSGKRIDVPTIVGKYCDTTAKFIAAANSPLVSDPFITFMDDTVIWNRIPLAELLIPRYVTQGVPGQVRSSWGMHVKRTLQQCESFGYSTYDTATHFPYPFEKAKLLETIEKFEATKKPVCLEVAYPNMHKQPVKKMDSAEFIRMKSFRQVPDTVQILNYGTIMARLRALLLDRFPKISEWETERPNYNEPIQPANTIQLAKDACVYLGDMVKRVPNFGGGRTPVFKCTHFGDDCSLARVAGVARNCLQCKLRNLRGSPLFIEAK